jgi:hypothetical protein
VKIVSKKYEFKLKINFVTKYGTNPEYLFTMSLL